MRLFPLLLLTLLGTLRADDRLFNGKDLSGWRVWLKDGGAGCFVVKDGVIECAGKPTGYLITEKEYGDYTLTLEWKWAEGAKALKTPNSGVLLHVSGPDAAWPRSVEAQLKRGYAGEIWLTEGFALTVDPSRQDAKVPRRYRAIKEDVEKPLGEWNRYEITCRGDAIEVRMNGVKVNEGTKAERTKGRIALQSEGAPIAFRNVTLTPLR